MSGLRFPKPYADRVAKMRVAVGFVLAAAFAYFSAPNAGSLLLGLPVAASGLVLRAWAAGHLAKNEQLALSGPYAYTRNPLYLGTLLVAAGLVVAARSWTLGVLFAGLFLMIYVPVIQLEEQHLRKLFPEYATYARRVPAVLPRISKGHSASPRFRLALYVKNEEYSALAGFLVAVLLLFWKVQR